MRIILIVPNMTNVFIVSLLILASFIPATSSWAKEAAWKMRARENYEIIQLEHPSHRWRYESFSHTFNIWYEKPFEYAVGLATGPYLMAYKEAGGQEDRPAELSDQIKLISHGIEGKLWRWGGFFMRGGIYYQQFNSLGSAGRDDALAGLLGGGYEWNLDGIGLAFEVDQRRSTLQSLDWSITSTMAAIGVHFYELL